MASRPLNRSTSGPSRSSVLTLSEVSPPVLTISLLLILSLTACSPVGEAGSQQNGEQTSEQGHAIEPAAPVDIELATLMGQLQRHSAKLGYAINGHNRPLATFYLEEIDEVLEELMTVEEDDGMPIAHPAGVILAPVLETLENNLATEVPWPEITGQYQLMIEACNRCHLATEHGFIEILPATGEPPFNQRFDGADS